MFQERVRICAFWRELRLTRFIDETTDRIEEDIDERKKLKGNECKNVIT